MSSVLVKERVKQLVDLVPDDELCVVERMLRGLVGVEADPVLRAFAEAPEGDEDFSAEDLASLTRGDADIAAGRVVSHEEARELLLEAE
jgi:predicted transcriptional regulator